MTASDIQARLVEGGSRELDVAIAVLFHPRSEPHPLYADRYRWKDDFGTWDSRSAVRVTTSVDAALALAERVLPGWVVASMDWWPMRDRASVCLREVKEFGEPFASFGFDESCGDARANARTPAAALCIAVLKAKALQDGRDG